MSRIMVTGGSGFIGTNLISSLVDEGHTVISIDIAEPMNIEHSAFFYRCDILDVISLRKVFTQFKPEVVVHLAARTDLEGKDLSEYSSNLLGVENICKVISENRRSINKVIFASSMLVCRAGYKPTSETDYCPDTIYGESKVFSEKIIASYSEHLPLYYVLRPTSIWGPWFREPYCNFFKMVLSGKFVDIGPRFSRKTYGYVGNSVNQIKSLAFHSKVATASLFYVGDIPPLHISEWAHLICTHAKIKKPIHVPFFFLLLAAFLGDLLKKVGLNFPITLFRLRNMTTDNVIDCSSVCDENKYEVISLADAIDETISWLRRE